MLPCSVTASAGMPSFCAWSSSSSTRQAPSSSENSVWRWRWTKSLTGRAPAPVPIADALLFPLDGGRRLRADVVDDPVDALDFVDDARRDAGQQVVRQARPVGGHPVAALDGADRDGVLVGA